MDPRYKVNTTAKLFALDEQHIDTILESLSLGTRMLVKKSWQDERPSTPLYGNLL